MTIKASPTIKDGYLTIRGKVVSTGVPENVVISPATAGSAFLGASAPFPASRHIFSLGVLNEYRFVSLFIVKIWWMIPRIGRSACEIPMETQVLLLEVTEESVLDTDFVASDNTSSSNSFYVLLLPVLDGQFRASLQGTSDNELQFYIESGDDNVQTSQVRESVFINSGDNPFELLKDSIKILEKHKGTFSHIDNKKIPSHLDWFGWCTWDAFYKEVNPQRIKEGLQSFCNGGCSPKYLIIDDGWQDTINEFQKEAEPIIEGSQFASRLVDIKENSKFKSSGSGGTTPDLHTFIGTVKEKYGVKYVYMWHALAGYWGGVLPSSETMQKYQPKLVYPIQLPSHLGNQRDIVTDSLEKYGVGVIDPSKIFDFYNDLHGYLASCGVDGVKVDVQNLVAMLGSHYGGRVTMTRQYQEALEQSIATNFEGNNLISCMCHNTDSIYNLKRSATARASEDFMPREPSLQTLHIASVAFNSLLLGEMVVPDWDMFHSKHDTADFHAAARAIGGCAVYVSDKPNNHDFEILKKIVLPDGSVLRAKHAARPTRDCLFNDPVMDGKSLLKIWNLNTLSGVIGVFNCQGAGNWPMKESTKEVHSEATKYVSISGRMSPNDVEFLDELAGEDWNNGDCAVYAFNSGSIYVQPRSGSVELSLNTLQCEVYTVSPIKVFGQGIRFAPIGLLNMYNSGGAIQAVSCVEDDHSETVIKVKGRGCGLFGVYSNTKPKCCSLEGKEKDFVYNDENGLLTIELQGDCNLHEIEFTY